MHLHRQFAEHESEVAALFTAARWASLSALLLALLPGCADAPEEGNASNAGAGASLETGGSALGGGGTGAAPSAGGTPGSGGTTGGTAETGGSAPVGGVATGGAVVATGGAPTGGAPTGGAPTGGAPTGGRWGEGTGGAQTGGAPTGGAPTGGAPTGGAPTGGAPTGGTPSVGKFVGNITTGWNGALDTGGRIYSDYWDQVTPENAGKWGSVQGSISSGRNWSTLDAIYDYAQSKNIIFKQHTFVWGPQQPSGSIGENDVKSWMQEFCERYPETRLIDVVNEPPPHTEPSYSNSIGGGTNGSWQWIANAFTWAREACPNAILILNDYNNVEWSDQTQHFIDIVKTIQAAGAPIDAIGAQSHGLSTMVSTQTMKSLMTKLHDDTGLPVYVTEYDIDLSDDNAQLGKYQEHIPFFMETEWIHGVTVWGWIYGSTWVPASGLIRDGQPRPAMTWLMEYLERPAP